MKEDEKTMPANESRKCRPPTRRFVRPSVHPSPAVRLKCMCKCRTQVAAVSESRNQQSQQHMPHQKQYRGSQQHDAETNNKCRTRYQPPRKKTNSPPLDLSAVIIPHNGNTQRYIYRHSKSCRPSCLDSRLGSAGGCRGYRSHRQHYHPAFRPSRRMPGDFAGGVGDAVARGCCGC